MMFKRRKSEKNKKKYTLLFKLSIDVIQDDIRTRYKSDAISHQLVELFF